MLILCTISSSAFSRWVSVCVTRIHSTAQQPEHNRGKKQPFYFTHCMCAIMWMQIEQKYICVAGARQICNSFSDLGHIQGSGDFLHLSLYCAVAECSLQDGLFDTQQLTHLLQICRSRPRNTHIYSLDLFGHHLYCIFYVKAKHEAGDVKKISWICKAHVQTRFSRFRLPLVNSTDKTEP